MALSLTSSNNIRSQLSVIANKLRVHQARISSILMAILIAAIAWVAAIMLWLILEPPVSAPEWSPKSVSSNGSVANRATTDVSDILNAKLFGEYTQSKLNQANSLSSVAQDAPQTKLKLQLVGVVANSNAALGLAVIANKGNRGVQGTYGIDEPIENTRATLKAVLNDRVIISNQGANETLMLDGVDYSKFTQASLPSSRNDQAEEETAQSDEEIEKLNEVKQQLASNPADIFKYVQLSQAMQNGELLGYRVSPGQERLLFDSVGLKNGDLAIELNGYDLTDPSQMTTLMADAMNATEWNITVTRDEQPHLITIAL